MRQTNSVSKAPQSSGIKQGIKINKEPQDYTRIGLAIDGGGMRGIIPATVINYLCKQTHYEVHQMFNCVGGTSIGGILALGVTGSLDGISPVANHEEIVKIFELHGSTIFNSSKLGGLFFNLIDKAKYTSEGLESITYKYFQNCKLSDVLKDTNVIVTAMRREIIQSKNPAKIFRSRDAVFNEKKNFFMRDVARATSAAPTFFPSAEIHNLNQTKRYSLVDGGLGQNNPSKLVLEDIKKEALNAGNENNFFLLSLGTGVPLTSAQLSQNAGVLNLMAIINSFGEGASAYVDAELKQMYNDRYLRVQPIVNLDKSQAQLDTQDPEIIKIYKQDALKEAIKVLSNEYKYGSFNDRPFIEWIAENTARKYDTYI